MECLLKVDNEDYIITNFEFRLEAFPWNKKLWEFYINYLKKINSKSILYVYSRYCRFFIDDIIAKEKYSNEIERIEKDLKINVTKWWIDIILMESNKEKAYKIFEEILSSKTPKSKKLLKFAQKFLKEKKTQKFTNLIQSAKRYITKDADSETSKDVLSNPAFENEILTFNFDGNVFFSIPTIDSIVQPFNTIGNFNTYMFQQFSFPKTICNYIFDNTNYIFRQKLFLTCKYFVVRYQTPICCNIVIKSSSNPIFYEQSIAIPESSITAVKNFYVGNTLDAWITENSLTVSNLCSIVFQFDLKYLKLHTQKLTQKEFEFLTAPGNIKSVYLVSVSIIDSNGKGATLEDIMKRFPKASRIRLFTSTEYSNETAQNLLTQKRNTKIEYFEFYSFALNVESFCQFIQENMAPQSQILVMLENVEEEYLQVFKSSIENMIKIWEPQNEKPVIDVLAED
uniref:Uncharacterized protein n=1 Tax=Panagrolaimus davidi TaxID=227884 RepID=A0A914PTJ2_9BILA